MSASSSSSSSRMIQQVEQTLEDKPKWLGQFLQQSFFGTCPHHSMPKNEQTKYCIECEGSACQNCIASGFHDTHNTFKIYKHSYKYAVLLSDIANHLDCSGIQLYRCNKKKVVALTPLPHCGSNSKAGSSSSCIICSRRLIDPRNYRYCSISCKVEDFARKENKQERARKRKGIPRRAPFGL